MLMCLHVTLLKFNLIVQDSCDTVKIQSHCAGLANYKMTLKKINLFTVHLIKKNCFCDFNSNYNYKCMYILKYA